MTPLSLSSMTWWKMKGYLKSGGDHMVRELTVGGSNRERKKS